MRVSRLVADVAQRRGVVFAAVDHESVIFRSEDGIVAPGVFGGHVQGFA
ncbi:MAG: hypothetical protein M3143_04835 [Actinomycetota bacterium]|nr:hypothetical protein [Actinomycetota bacterium]